MDVKVAAAFGHIERNAPVTASYYNSLPKPFYTKMIAGNHKIFFESPQDSNLEQWNLAQAAAVMAWFAVNHPAGSPGRNNDGAAAAGVSDAGKPSVWSHGRRGAKLTAVRVRYYKLSELTLGKRHPERKLPADSSHRVKHHIGAEHIFDAAIDDASFMQ